MSTERLYKLAMQTAHCNSGCSRAVPKPEFGLSTPKGSCDFHLLCETGKCLQDKMLKKQIHRWCSRNEDTLGENFFLRISVFAIFRSLGTCCKGQVLTFRKLPLMNQDENHLVQGFFFQCMNFRREEELPSILRFPLEAYGSGSKIGSITFHHCFFYLPAHP